MSRKLADMPHPMQPIGFHENGTIRFKQNAIVDFLVHLFRNYHPCLVKHVRAYFDSFRFGVLIEPLVEDSGNQRVIHDRRVPRFCGNRLVHLAE